MEVVDPSPTPPRNSMKPPQLPFRTACCKQLFHRACLAQYRECAADHAAMARRIGAMRRRLDGHVFPMLEKWFARASKHKDVRAACVISAHLAMLLKNAEPDEIDGRAVTTLLASHVFLTHNFAWDAEKPIKPVLGSAGPPAGKAAPPKGGQGSARKPFAWSGRKHKLEVIV